MDEEYVNINQLSDNVKKFLESNNYPYKTSIQNFNDLQILNQLILNDNGEKISKLNDNVRYISGLYFEKKNNIEMMKNEYQLGIENGCSECMNLLGLYYYHEKDYDSMLGFWEQAFNKKNIEAIINLSRYFDHTNQYDKMIHALQFAMDLGSEKAYKYLAIHYYKKGKVSEMIEIYRKAGHKGFSSCLLDLGNYYLKIGDHQNKLKYYRLAAQNNPEAMYYLAIYYQSIQEFDTMREYFMKAAFDYKHIKSILSLGEFYKKTKQYKLMENVYEIGAKQNNPDALNSLGLYYHKIKQKDKMLRCYGDAIKYGSINALNNLAIYYESIGNYKEMKKLLEKAISFNSSIAMYNMGLYYEKIGDHDKMGHYFMMSYQNGRIFDKSEMKLMKKSILKNGKPHLIDKFIKTFKQKKNQLKSILFDKREKSDEKDKDNEKENDKDKEKVKDKEKKEKKKSLKKKESIYKFSKEKQENQKPQNDLLIDVPDNEPKTIKSLFDEMHLYKFMGNLADKEKENDKKQQENEIIDETFSTLSNNDWLFQGSEKKKAEDEWKKKKREVELVNEEVKLKKLNFNVESSSQPVEDYISKEKNKQIDFKIKTQEKNPPSNEFDFMSQYNPPQQTRVESNINSNDNGFHMNNSSIGMYRFYLQNK
jgi:hypothetical protein